MRTIITLKPTADGKTRITRETLFEKFVKNRAHDVEESEGRYGEVYNNEGKKVRVWIPSKKTASKEAGDAKDLFIGTRGLSQEREDGHLDHAYNEEKGFKIPPPKDPKERAEWEAGVARRKAEGKGTFVGDSANRRKIIVHNHLPRVKVNDEDNAAALQARGRGLVDVYTKSIDVRDWCKRQSLGRAQEAFVLTGWKQARKESGLSENV